MPAAAYLELEEQAVRTFDELMGEIEDIKRQQDALLAALDAAVDTQDLEAARHTLEGA